MKSKMKEGLEIAAVFAFFLGIAAFGELMTPAPAHAAATIEVCMLGFSTDTIKVCDSAGSGMIYYVGITSGTATDFLVVKDTGTGLGFDINADTQTLVRMEQTTTNTSQGWTQPATPYTNGFTMGSSNARTRGIALFSQN